MAAAFCAAEILAAGIHFIARHSLCRSTQPCLTFAEEAWLAADFPLEPHLLASIADQVVARLTRDQEDQKQKAQKRD
jgi:hypothetical protein